jgi:hypothetical protein
MSTRSQVFFYENRWPKRPVSSAYSGMENGTPQAGIYHHCDGYPTERLPNINEAFEVSSRRDDMGDVAAWYVKIHKDGDGGVYIDNFEHGDLDYVYQVWFEGEPMVKVRQYSLDGCVLFEGTLAYALETAEAIEAL